MLGATGILKSELLKVDWSRTFLSGCIFSVDVWGKGTIELEIGLVAGNKDG